MNILKGISTNAVDSISHSFNLLWAIMSPMLLPLVCVLVFLALGLWIAEFLSDKLGSLVKKSNVDNFIDKVLAPVLEITGTKINTANVINGTIKWFLVGMVLIAALEIADLDGVILFCKQIVHYLPAVFSAALIILAGSMLANLAATIVGFVSKGNFPTTVRVAVNALALITALSLVVTPIVGALSKFIGQLTLSRMQSDVLFIGLIILALLASKNAVTKTVENWYKT